jgi:putative oxidoreductase
MLARMPPLASLGKHQDLGLLILRIGIGAMFMAHGFPKLSGGPSNWARIGASMANFGLDFAPTFWGLCAALAEFGGGLLLGLGLWTRPACLALAFTMLVASVKHWAAGDSFVKASHAMELFVLFVAVLFVGPGKWSLDKR